VDTNSAHRVGHFSIASLGAVVLAAVAGLGIYVVGVVLIYVATVQPGPAVGVAASYVLLGIVAPIAAAVKSNRSGRSSWRKTVTIASLVSLVASIVFFPFVTVALAM